MTVRIILLVSITIICQHICCCQTYDGIEGIKKDTIYPPSYEIDSGICIRYTLEKDYTFNVCFLANGNKLREYYLINDELTGPYKEWYEDGELRQWGTTINGATVGPLIEWHKNGQIKRISFYPYDDNIKMEYTNDTIVEIGDDYTEYRYPITYIGKLRTGISKGYYENGQLEYLGNYVNGHKEGIWQYWDEKGKLIRTEKLIKGRWVELIIYEGEKEIRRTNEYGRF